MVTQPQFVAYTTSPRAIRPRIVLGTKFRFVRCKPEHLLFGITDHWTTRTVQIRVSDLERTVLMTLGGLDAVLLTHAHLDHSGALPLVHGAFPSAEVLCTEPTAAILRVLLLDAVKIMEKNAGAEDEILLYPLPSVEALLGRLTTVRFLYPISLCAGLITATFFPAGRVLGAALIGLQTPEGNLLVTGDVLWWVWTWPAS